MVGQCGIALDALAQGVVLQHVHADEIGAEVVEDLHHGGGEAARGLFGHALHEQGHGCSATVLAMKSGPVVSMVSVMGLLSWGETRGARASGQGASVSSASAWSSPPIRPPSA